MLLSFAVSTASVRKGSALGDVLALSTVPAERPEFRAALPQDFSSGIGDSGPTTTRRISPALGHVPRRSGTYQIDAADHEGSGIPSPRQLCDRSQARIGSRATQRRTLSRVLHERESCHTPVVTSRWAVPRKSSIHSHSLQQLHPISLTPSEGQGGGLHYAESVHFSERNVVKHIRRRSAKKRQI
jgi:hypothetical protein